MLISIFNGIAVKDRWIIDFQMAISVRFSRRPRCTGATALGRCPQLAAETWGVHAEQSEGCTAAASKQRSRARPIRADSARAQVHLKAPAAERSGDATLLAAGGARNAGVSARARARPRTTPPRALGPLASTACLDGYTAAARWPRSVALPPSLAGFLCTELHRFPVSPPCALSDPHSLSRAF